MEQVNILHLLRYEFIFCPSPLRFNSEHRGAIEAVEMFIKLFIASVHPRLSKKY